MDHRQGVLAQESCDPARGSAGGPGEAGGLAPDFQLLPPSDVPPPCGFALLYFVLWSL